MIQHPRRGLLGAEVGEMGVERQQMRLYTGRRRLVHKRAARGFREGRWAALTSPRWASGQHADERSTGVDD